MIILPGITISVYQRLYVAMTAEEATAWSQIQQKDMQAFEQYYKAEYRSFFLMACKYLRDPAQAEEIVNDVFVKIWEDGHSINIETSLKAYIYRAVINRSLNVLSKYKKEADFLKELSRKPEAAFEPRHLEDHELKLRLYAAIEQLPEQCRRVFMMSRFEALKQQEIADRLGISIKTVKNHITLALKKLADTLDNDGLSILVTLVLLEIFSGRLGPNPFFIV